MYHIYHSKFLGKHYVKRFGETYPNASNVLQRNVFFSSLCYLHATDYESSSLCRTIVN